MGYVGNWSVDTWLDGSPVCLHWRLLSNGGGDGRVGHCVAQRLPLLDTDTTSSLCIFLGTFKNGHRRLASRRLNRVVMAGAPSRCGGARCGGERRTSSLFRHFMLCCQNQVSKLSRVKTPLNSNFVWTSNGFPLTSAVNQNIIY